MLTESSAAAAGSTSSTERAAATLWGIVTAYPPMSSTGMAASTAPHTTVDDVECDEPPVEAVGVEHGVVHRRRQ